MLTRPFNGAHEGRQLTNLSFPIGGLGAGMFCLDGTGAFSHFSIRHRPGIFKEYATFSAISIKKGKEQKAVARVLGGSRSRLERLCMR
jgi:beta-glucosidase 2, glycosyl-hydrolase family 116 N-term